MSGRTTPAETAVDASGIRVAIAAARFNGEITERLLEGALSCLERHGAPQPAVLWVPGAFELPLSARALIDGGADAVVALGCVIRGETPHFDYVAGECAAGLMRVMLDTRVPVSFGVLTTEDQAQAEARAGGEHGNKGFDAALAAIETAAALREVPGSLEQ